jgi:phosphohistidine swiveling domain-containing protein
VVAAGQPECGGQVLVELEPDLVTGVDVGPVHPSGVAGPDALEGSGDILVCRFNDPAWTPLFGIVDGVITEIGGRLSSAAIVAREHRIPALLGVPAAMTTLHDAQPLTLDGTTGTIHMDRGIAG